LRSDEIVWGRAPVRLDLAGGWTDTPPFALEHGGCVANAAVDLNGQPPIQVYARVTPEPAIRIHSIDLGTDVEIRRWEELDDYSATGEFSLVKAALGLAGFSRAVCGSPDASLAGALSRFGGGLELTTLAAVPKGSGLGTSSIMGAVVLAVIHRVLGRELSTTELFHAVLRLEQALTTGGGWQDQVGGVLAGVKLITTRPGLVPDPAIRYMPPDVLDPQANGGQTLLYYTGITRLAKNILGQVVGRYLDRNRSTMATLRSIRALASKAADAMARKDLEAFGHAIGTAWRLNKRLDPASSNDEIEALLARVRPHLFGAKLLGAGGGGFLLLVCRSAGDAAQVKQRLEADPPNRRARFFHFDISREGLSLSAC
jgi:galactokinase/mevalonate kinase-like predicted kinase